MSNAPKLSNLADMVRDRAKSRGDALAYEFEGRQTSFAEFDVKTNRVANALIAMGIKKGERIAYLGKNSDFYFELLMGAMKAGVVMAPVNWRLAGPEVAFIVDDCKAPLLFVGPEFVTQARNISDKLPSVRSIITTEGGAPEWPDYLAWRDAQSGDDPRVAIEPKDIAIQLTVWRLGGTRDSSHIWQKSLAYHFVGWAFSVPFIGAASSWTLVCLVANQKVLEHGCGGGSASVVAYPEADDPCLNWYRASMNFLFYAFIYKLVHIFPLSCIYLETSQGILIDDDGEGELEQLQTREQRKA